MQNENVRFKDIVGTAVTLKTDDGVGDSEDAHTPEEVKAEKKIFTIDEISF